MELQFSRFWGAVGLGIGRIRQGNTGLFGAFGGLPGAAYRFALVAAYRFALVSAYRFALVAA